MTPVTLTQGDPDKLGLAAGEREELRQFLDDGLDDLAAIARQGGPLRLGIACVVAFLSHSMVPTAACLIWLAVIAAGELVTHFMAEPQARGERGGPAFRAAYALNLLVAATAWMALGALLWASGSAAGAISAVPSGCRWSSSPRHSPISHGWG